VFIGGCSVFRHFDADRSGTIERHELANALRQFGYNLGPHLLELIEHKFGASHSSWIVSIFKSNLANLPYSTISQPASELLDQVTHPQE
jgi:hypothetical protein